ncbi:MAG: FAD-binding oxidoreductase [bacterium]|nr:FAD-binding oxidoreductase [bacterium]
MSDSLWLREAPAVTPPSTWPDRVDVAVIGGGVAGVATALHLAERNVHVALLEAGAIASRASGRNDGQLLLGLGEHYHRIHGQFGSERAPLLWDFLRDNHTALRSCLAAGDIDCDFAQMGGLRLAETPHEWTELEEAAAVLAREQRPHELVPASALDQWLPLGHEFHGALHLPEEAVLQPARLVRGLARIASSSGASLHEDAAVARVTGEAGDFTIELADGRTLRAAVVVHCTSTLGRELDPSGLLARTVFPFRGQVIATDPLPIELASRFPPYAMSSNFCYEYFRMHRGRFVVGGMRWSVPGEEQGTLDDSVVNPTITQNLRDYVRKHFPALDGHDFPHAWTGIMAGTPDGLPLVGPLPGSAGQFALLAFNGYGLSFAFLAGRCLAELVVDGQSPHPAMPLFQPRRFADAALGS